MAHSLTKIGGHLECAIQTELVVELELALIQRKQSRQFRHHSKPKRFGVNVHLRQLLLKTVKVIERSRDVTPISLQKEGNTDDVSNLRPISLLPLAGKLLEKIVHGQIIK